MEGASSATSALIAPRDVAPITAGEPVATVATPAIEPTIEPAAAPAAAPAADAPTGAAPAAAPAADAPAVAPDDAPDDAPADPPADAPDDLPAGDAAAVRVDASEPAAHAPNARSEVTSAATSAVANVASRSCAASASAAPANVVAAPKEEASGGVGGGPAVPARSTRGSRFSSFAGAPFAGVPGALGAAAAAEAESELKTFLPESGVPRADMLELLRGPPDVLLAVWTYWKTKRENDKEGLPILSRLRQEAIQMAARKARWWSTVTDMQRLHSHLKQARARRCSVLGQQCGLSPIHMPPPARPGSCISCSRTSNLARGSSGK